MRFTNLHLGLVLVAAGACASGAMEGSDTMSASKATIPQAQQPAPAPLTDANIAAIVVAANGIDVENGKLAIERATDS